ncbi:hypothetical protein [Paenibacillus sp. IITD108]|uniref:hypothetical protein n=1 Tax=Paenibacillus sp. IITD108 TaxID=3116649 RepID=UPI002F42D16C
MAVINEKTVTRIGAANLAGTAGGSGQRESGNSDNSDNSGKADTHQGVKQSKDGSEPAQLQKGAGSPPIQTEAELQLVKRHILLGIMMQILNHDIRVIDSAGMKLPRLYESMLRAVQDRVLLDLAHTRRLFREHGIKVYEEKRQTDGLHAKYVCRGYHHHFFMLWGFVKAESERMLKQYIILST